LEIGGVDAVELAEQYGTPLYVLNADMVVERARAFQKAMAKYYPQGEVIYASKALFSGAVAKLLKETGVSIDVVSGGELFVALKAGFPPERIFFHGNNKTPQEFEMAVKNGVGTVVVDNWHELSVLNEVAGGLGKKQKIYLRVAPGIHANTHVHIQTGQEDSKFGFSKKDIVEASKKAVQSESLRLAGLHCHIGSQITNLDSFYHTAKIMNEIISEIEKELEPYSFKLEELDLGGGLAIAYQPEDPVVSPDEMIAAIYRALPNPELKLKVEPGRYLVGEAGVTLYTVGSSKEIPGVRKYVAVDGGMTDNPRVALYDAKYHAVVANKANAPKEEKVSIAGKCCESGDMLIYDIDLPRLEAGDILAIFSTGAYNYSMASNYNLLPRPAMVFISSGKAELVVRRETYEDLLLRDLAIRE
jgi:diaminopimelate decarboxylase